MAGACDYDCGRFTHVEGKKECISTHRIIEWIVGQIVVDNIRKSATLEH